MPRPGRSSPASDLLWKAFWARRSRFNRNKLALHYAPLSEMAANTVRANNRRIRADYDADELASMAMVVLIEAISRYDPAAQTDRVPFEQFVKRRLFGEMYDTARREGGIPRTNAGRVIADSVAAFRAVHGWADPPISLETTIVAADNLFSPDLTLGGTLRAPNADPAELYADGSDRHDRLEVAMRVLSARERKVIRLHDFDGVSLKKVGAMLGVGESRVCQIRSLALQRLRVAMGAA